MKLCSGGHLEKEYYNDAVKDLILAISFARTAARGQEFLAFIMDCIFVGRSRSLIDIQGW